MVDNGDRPLTRRRLRYEVPMTKYLLLALIVFAINLLPAFGPPTWTIIVYAHLRWSLNPVVLVFISAAMATSGRYLLASGARYFRERVPRRYREGLTLIERRLSSNRKGVIALGALFILSPLPSAQLFVAAGLLKMPLIRISGLFFIGRLVTYSLYLSGSVTVNTALGGLLTRVWGNPWAIVLQLIFVSLIAIAPSLAGARKKSADGSPTPGL